MVDHAVEHLIPDPHDRIERAHRALRNRNTETQLREQIVTIGRSHSGYRRLPMLALGPWFLSPVLVMAVVRQLTERPD